MEQMSEIFRTIQNTAKGVEDESGIVKSSTLPLTEKNFSFDSRPSAERTRVS